MVAMQFYPNGKALVSDNNRYKLVGNAAYHRVEGEHWQGLGEGEDVAEAAEIATAHFNGKKHFLR